MAKFFRNPPGLVSGRSEFWTMDWEVAKPDLILPAFSAMTVDAQAMGSSALVFEVSVTGKEEENRKRHLWLSSNRIAAVRKLYPRRASSKEKMRC